MTVTSVIVGVPGVVGGVTGGVTGGVVGGVVGGGVVVTGAFTVTDTLPVLEGSAVEVAITYRVVSVSLADTVSKPLELILVPCATAPVPAAFELTLHVTVLGGLFDPVTDALNWRLLPLSIDRFAGLTETPVTTGINILTTALPVLDGSTVDAAIT